MLEAAEEWICRFVGVAAEGELRLAAGDAHQADKLELIVVGQRAAEELELPIRPAADVEHAVRTAAAIDDDLPFVVRERGFGRLGRTAGARRLRRGRDRNARPVSRA